MPAQLRLIKPDEPRAAYRGDALALLCSCVVCAGAAAIFTALGYRGRLAPVAAGPCAVAFALCCASLALSWAELKTQRFVLGSRFLEVERGIFSRRAERIELWRVRDVQLVQGLFERFRGAGRIALVVGDQGGERRAANATVILGPVANARSLHDALAAMLAERNGATASGAPVRDRR